LFKSRRHDAGEQLRRAMLEVEAERPHWRVCGQKLLTECAGEIKPSGVYRLDFHHGPNCPALDGRLEDCRCRECSAELLELVVKA
jgi:hypothetical protein